MEKNLVFLLVLGMVASSVFAGDMNYRDFVLREMDPAGDPLPVYNCEGDEDGGPFYIEMFFTIGNPFGEKLDAKAYVYNPNTQEWTLHKTWTNIDPSGERRDAAFPLIWGMSRNGTNRTDFVRIEMSKGAEVYSKTFSFNMHHSETTQESLIWERMGYLEGLISELKSGTYCNADATACCPLNSKVDDFDGVNARSIALGKECKIREARQNVMDAINAAELLKKDAESCSKAIAELNAAEEMASNCNDASLAAEVSSLREKVKAGDYGISAGEAQAIYAEKCKNAPPVTVEEGAGTGSGASGGAGSHAGGAATTGSGTSSGGICPAGFLILAAAAFAFAQRGE
ncbi:MAG: hypothetical protein QXH30_03800 [Candidatus Bilamarchaeaceae archaeon]